MRANPSFHSLPPELVVMVASNLDVSSYLAPASTSLTILDILVSPHQWKALLQKTRMKNKPVLEKLTCISSFVEKQVMEQEVRELARFIKFAKDPQGVLLLDFLEHICKRFLVDPTSEMPKRWASLSCACLAIHQVTSFGFALTEQAEIEVRGAGTQPQQNLVAYKGSGLEHLEEFASRALRQKQKITNIELFCIYNGDGGGWGNAWEVWLKLIQNCDSWKIEKLTMYNYSEDNLNTDDLVEGLAKEAARGAIGMLRIDDTCIANSQMAHLKRLWNITEGEWIVKSLRLHDFRLRKDQRKKWRKMIDVIKTLKERKDLIW